MEAGALMGQTFDLKICDSCAADVRDAHSEHQRIDKVSDNHILAMDGFILSKPFVGVKWVMIHRDHAKEMVISFGNGLAWPVSVHVAYLKIL
jgi:hypothetical protein